MLLLANRARTEPVRSVDLWRLADLSTANAEARRTAYRHALIHAGRTPDPATERPFTACPVCEETLG